jgi:UrcA family protein
MTIKIGNALCTSIAIISLGWMSVGQAAEQAAPSPLATQTVRFEDLNLSHASGAERLYHRIAAAAQQVCSGNENPVAVADKVRVQVCIEQSIQRAIASVDNPGLTALYVAKTGRSLPVTVLAKRN